MGSGCALPAFSRPLLSLLPIFGVPLVLAVVLNPILLFAEITVFVCLVLAAASTLWRIARRRFTLLKCDQITTPPAELDVLRGCVSKVRHLQVHRA